MYTTYTSILEDRVDTEANVQVDDSGDAGVIYITNCQLAAVLI